jgi:PAS domain-containing protein
MKIHAIISVYNAYETIWECLESLIDIVDRIVILDGRWIGFEGESLTSNDGTSLEIEEFMVMCKQQAEVDIDYFVATKENHQYEARNFLLDQVPVGDWFLIIDSDEKIIDFPQNLREILDYAKESGNKNNGFRCGGLDETQESGPRPYDIPKLLQKTKGMKYTSNHRYLYDDNGAIDLGHTPPLVKLVIYHQGCKKAMRPVMEKYKSWLFQWENSHR